MTVDRDAGLDEYFADYERRAAERRARRGARRRRRRVPRGELGALLASPAGRTLVGLVAAIAALTVIGLAVLWPRADANPRGQSLPRTLPAHVEAVREAACDTPTPQRCRQIVIRVGRAQSTLDLGPITSAPEVSAGHAVRVTEVPRVAGVAQPRDAPRYSFVDVERRRSILIALAVVAVLALVLLRWRGLLAALGITVTLLLACGLAAGGIELASLDGRADDLTLALGQQTQGRSGRASCLPA